MFNFQAGVSSPDSLPLFFPRSSPLSSQWVVEFVVISRSTKRGGAGRLW